MRPITFDRAARTVAVIALIAAGVWLINTLKDVLLPFCVACLLAYMLEPLVQFQMQKLKLKHRVIPVFLTLLEVGCLVALILYFIVPSAIDEINQLDKMIHDSAADRNATAFLPPDLQEYVRQLLNANSLTDLLSGSRIEAILNKSTTVLTATVDFLLHTLEWLMTFIYVIFILLDYNRLMRGFRMIVPPKFRPTVYKIADDIKDSMNRYFRSQALIALCAAVFYCIGFSIVKLPMAIIMGLTVGVLYMIPYFQYVTLIPVIILCYMMSLGGDVSFWVELGKCGLVYVISQCICDYILTPKIMGKALGLNPAIILLSLSVWGTLLGIIGMIIALPATTLLIAYYEQYVINDTNNTNQ